MTFIGSIRSGFWHWLNAVAASVVALIARFTSSRLVRVVEEPDGSLVYDGEKLGVAEGRLVEPLPQKLAARLRKARVELMLQPGRFVFRPLELPQRATDFLGGIVRAQIDRLTPWSAEEAAFGWTLPKDLTGDRMLVTVVATSRALIAPLVTGLSAHGPKMVRALTRPPEAADAAPVQVWDYAPGGAIDLRRVRFVLASLLVLMLVAAAGSLGALVFIGDDLDAQRFEISRRIADKRASALIGRDGLGNAAIAGLERRKREVPSSVIVIEAGSHLCDGDAHYRRPPADRRRQPRRTGLDPADRAVVTFHPRDVLCADDALARRTGRAFQHRGSHRARLHAGDLNGRCDRSFVHAGAMDGVGRLCRRAGRARLCDVGRPRGPQRPL
jgi:general secretion pathway protein L